MRVLVAIDFSIYSHNALEQAIDTLSKKDPPTEFIVFTVPEKGIYWPGLLECNPMLIEKGKKCDLKASRKNLNACGDMLSRLKLKYRLVLCDSNKIGDSIIDACEKYNVDCLFIGSKGHGKVREAIMGSKTLYCVTHAPCSVFVVKTEKSEAKKLPPTSEEDDIKEHFEEFTISKRGTVEHEIEMM
eukprot:TRINITY_DN1334_c0_g1_i2.p1 TRINITY_DN1334_c0_g1~~TRINITY_DN1334_c0_g1_i2.p1  ORF type:complete len:186 (-),score=20.97 TRINITY_DN1334_c0_g1_i2:95-652(-)